MPGARPSEGKENEDTTNVLIVVSMAVKIIPGPC